MNRLQEWIHALELGVGARWLKVLLAVLAFGTVSAAFNWREFRNLDNRQAMDLAQVARNIARGEGYTTSWIRPVSIHRLEVQNPEVKASTGAENPAPWWTAHPDLANPPVYPGLLAAAMKLLPFDPSIPDGRPFGVYQPDLLIALVNQSLLLILAGGVFALGRALFDRSVGVVAACALVGSNIAWQTTLSGLPDVLLALWFCIIAAVLWRTELGERRDEWRRGRILCSAVVVGLLLGLGTLTRYGFGFLALPVAAFFVISFKKSRWWLLGVTLGVFLLVLFPWLWRNHALSGNLFGTAGYSLLSTIQGISPEGVERSLDPVLGSTLPTHWLGKLMSGLPGILVHEIIWLGGGWILAFYLLGLLSPFQDPGRNRVQGFVLLSAVVVIAIEALVRPTQSTSGSESHTGGLLFVVSPVVCVFGAAVLCNLLDQLSIAGEPTRPFLLGVAVAALSVPLIIRLLPMGATPPARSSHSPPYIQRFCAWMDRDELLMSDIPWAVAWYGDRKCVSPTRYAVDQAGEEDFFAINDLRKPVRGLYLSLSTLDTPFLSGILEGEDGAWGRFVASSLLEEELPPGFPLRHAPTDFLKRGHLFLTDQKRWSKPGRDEVE